MTKGTFFKRAFSSCIIAAFLLFFGNISNAQTSTAGVNSDGRDFFIGSVFPSFNKNPNHAAGRDVSIFFKTYALISGYQDCKVHVSYFNDKTGVEMPSQTFNVPGRGTVQISLDSIRTHLTEPGDIAEFKSCHITSDAPVNVQFFSYGANSGGSYLALATNTLGKNYDILSYNDNPGYGAATNNGSSELAGGFFEIIAAFDNTKVTITPNGRTAGGHTGVNTGKASNGVPLPYNVTLSRGECYWVKGDGSDDGNDMTGSVVTSDKPIAVLAGHEDAFIGDVGNRTLDSRDFMIEQLIPAEAWDTTGYVLMPLKDPVGIQPEESGFGENYRVFTNNPNQAKIELDMASYAGDFDMYTTKFAYPLPEKTNVSEPIELHSIDGHKFGVMMYDNRAQGNAPPYPAESMMGIIPMSRWKTSYMLYVPANEFVVLQNYYFNLIALRNDIDKNYIKYSLNGGSLQPLSGLSLKGSYTNIPHHPELKGARYSISPGSYYFVNTRDAYIHPLSTSGSYQATDVEVAVDTSYLRGRFMVYNYGMRALDPDRDLGDFDNEDFFFSYANPTGASLSSGDPGKFTVTVDSLCGKWHVCVQDNRVSDPGIRSITILNDSAGVQFYPAKQSYNAHLDPVIDKGNVGDAELPGTASNVCFDVLVSKPLDSAYAAVMITDNAGNLKVVEFRAQPSTLVITLPSAKINFINSAIGHDSCSLFSIKNSGSSSQIIETANITPGSRFSISSVAPVLPTTLAPGDSLSVKVCFSPKDTNLILDTLRILFGCLTEAIQLSGKGATGLISATDQTFGKIDTGKIKTVPISITNIGLEQFNLTNNWTIIGSKAFSFASQPFPITLPPAGLLKIDIQYAPKSAGKDTAIIYWSTDILAPYNQSVKSFSILSGEGIVNTTSVHELQPTPTISVRPNPAKGNSIILTLGEVSAENIEIHIFDLLGREMYKKNISPEGKDSQLEIPISNLQNGIYYARVTMGGKTVTEKFEVMR